MPDDPEDKKHVVLWDYSNGLVRITPFFKALKYTKVSPISSSTSSHAHLLTPPFQTAPNKALTCNPGLKILSHSITGGALVAQGYWVPYSCARAICLTFCHDIRWALTPIFGQSFIRECFRPDHPGYAKFKIEAEVVRCAQLEADGWRTGVVGGGDGESKEIPRSVPASESGAMSKELRPRAARPTFKLGSPFDSDADTSEAERYTHSTPSLANSAEISPKTSTSTFATTPWTSINRPTRFRSSLASPPDNTSAGSLSNSLLTQPYHTATYSWRPAGSHDEDSPRNTKTSTRGLDTSRIRKRRHSSINKTESDPDADYTDHSDPGSKADSSESDDVDIITTSANKRQRRKSREDTAATLSTEPVIPSRKRTGGRSKKYTAQDARAARWLLNLSTRDATLSTGPNGPVQVVGAVEETKEKDDRCETDEDEDDDDSSR